jgi:hypothetical protein
MEWNIIHEALGLDCPTIWALQKKLDAGCKKGKSKRLFSGKSLNDWGGAQTWLQIVFCKPIAVFGLALEQNEVFLRWLLIERARYYRNFPEQKMPAWYFYVSDKENPGKITFLKHIGISPIKVKNYDELYGSAVWQ